MDVISNQLLSSLEAEQPLQTQNRLCTSNIMYIDRDKCYIIVKTISANATINFFENMDKINKNYAFYKERLEHSPFIIIPNSKEFQRNENYAFLMQRQTLKRTLNDRITQSIIETSEVDVFWIVSQTLFAVAQMHMNQVPHCNISPSNVVLTSSDDVYVTDMGFIQPHFFRRQDYNVISFFYPRNHTEFYLSPERIDPNTVRTEFVNLRLSTEDKQQGMLLKSDAFALGCVIYKFVTKGRVLFNLQRVYDLASSPDYRAFLKADMEEVKNERVRELILEMVDPNWERRISVQEAFKRWNSLHLSSPIESHAVIFHFQFLLRQMVLSRPDFKVFVINLFFGIAEEKGLFGIVRSNPAESLEMLMIVYRRFFELLGASKVSDFMENVAPLFGATEAHNAHAEVLDSIYKKAKQLQDECSIKPPLSNRLTDVVSRQNNTQNSKDSKKLEHRRELDLKVKRREALTKILSFMDQPQPTDRRTVAIIFMRQLTSIFADCDSEEGIHLGLIAIKKYVINVSSKDILIHIIPVLYAGIKSRHQKVSKLKFLRTLIYALKSIRYLDCPDFSKMHTIEKYIFAVVRYILASQNDLLVLTLLKNLKSFIKVSLILSISHVRVTEGKRTYEEVVASKTYVQNYLEIRAFFMDKIQTALHEPRYTTVVLRQIDKFLHYLSDFWSLQTLVKLTLEYMQPKKMITDAVLLFPFLLNNECQLIRTHMRILTEVLKKHDREEMHLASLAAITTMVRLFKTLDPLFFKTAVLKPLLEFYRQATTQLTKARVIRVFQYVFRRLPEADINRYFREEIQAICQVNFPIGRVSKDSLERILSKVIFKDDLDSAMAPVSSRQLPVKNDSATQLQSVIRDALELQNATPQPTHNLQTEISQFLFAYYLVELTSTQKNSDYRINESFEQYLALISEMVQHVAPTTFNLDIAHPDQTATVDWKAVTETLRNIHKSLCKFETPNRTLFYNREKALFIIDNFLKFIEVSHIETINNSIRAHPEVDLARFRQTRPKGNIKATLFDSKTSVKCLEKGKNSLFFAGNDSGVLFTYNLETMSSRDTPSLLMRTFEFKDGKSITKVIADDNCTTIVGRKDPVLSFYDLEANKVSRECLLAEKAFVVDMKFVQSVGGGFSNSFVSVDDTGKLNVFDARVKTRSFGMKLNPVMGIPTCLVECSKLFGQFYMATNRGYLTRYDLRMNMFCEFFRLYNHQHEFLPINTLAEFIPTSKFTHIPKQNNCLLFTYPSENNEFSVFDVDVTSEANRFLPKVHFIAEFNNAKTKSECQVTAPTYLQLVENQSIFNLKEDQFFDSFEILKVLAEKKQIFKNNPQSYLSMIDGYMRTLISESNVLSSFNVSQEISALVQQKVKDQSLRKVLSYPSYRAMKRYDRIAFDNILITGGDDRIIRFFNFGNSLAESQSNFTSSGPLPAYHLFNPDLVERSFYYFLEDKQMMIIKENTMPSVVKSDDFNRVSHSFGSEETTGNQGGSGQSLMQKHNFASEISNKRAFLPKSTATPCHELAINDLLMMSTQKGLCIVSCGEDGYVKIWD